MGKARKKQIRAEFRRAVFERDGHKCRVCDKQWSPEDADPSLKRINAHHITDRSEMPNGGYVKENGITVCEEPCHRLVEEFHISGGQRWSPGLHPRFLYLTIGSSYEKAVRASEGLG